MKNRILIVEDELIIAMDLRMTLNRLGYNVIGIVNRGETSLSIARESSPDLILMDINIKGKLNGIQVAEQLSDENIPIIFVTAQNDDNTICKIKNLSCEYLIKPFNEVLLQRKIERVLID